MIYKETYREWTGVDGFLNKTWEKAGFFHREVGPAIICYYPDGSIKHEAFWIYGNPHRNSGPAKIWYNPDGSIELESFWISGNLIGKGKEGFWKLWERLNKMERQAPDILKCLARYS